MKKAHANTLAHSHTLMKALAQAIRNSKTSHTHGKKHTHSYSHTLTKAPAQTQDTIEIRHTHAKLKCTYIHIKAPSCPKKKKISNTSLTPKSAEHPTHCLHFGAMLPRLSLRLLMRQMAGVCYFARRLGLPMTATCRARTCVACT